jgi:hypothetical protein
LEANQAKNTAGGGSPWPLKGGQMAYKIDLQDAAQRHLRGAHALHDQSSAGSQPGCKALAGYAYGLAAELAIKEIMRQSGIPRLADDKRKHDAYWKHFPDLKDVLGLQLRGRREGELRKYVDDKTLFEHWSIRMRYAPSSDVNPAWLAKWKKSAEDLIVRMNAA